MMLVMVGGCDGCDARRTNALRLLAKSEPELAELRDNLGEVRDLLPLRGNERESGCAESVQGDLVGISEDHVIALARKDGAASDDSRLLTGEPLRSLPTQNDLAEIKRSADPDSIPGLVEQIGRATELTHVVVLRTNELDSGDFEGQTITKPGVWKGWAFVVELDGPTLLAALPRTITTPSTVAVITKRGDVPTLMPALVNSIYTELANVTREQCGAALLKK